MNPKQAIESLEYLINNQKTVTTEKIKKPVEVLRYYSKMLESDNKKLRNRVKRQKDALRRLNDDNNTRT